MERLRILFSEDDPALAGTIRALLEAAGHEVLPAADVPPEPPLHFALLDVTRSDVSALVHSIRAWRSRAAELRVPAEERSLVVALRDHRAIGTAVGVLMERHRLSAERAFDALRRQARSERVKLVQLASGIVAGTAQLRVGL